MNELKTLRQGLDKPEPNRTGQGPAAQHTGDEPMTFAQVAAAGGINPRSEHPGQGPLPTNHNEQTK